MIEPESISVVIPVAKDEAAWPDLVASLERLLPRASLILCGPAPSAPHLIAARTTLGQHAKVKWIEQDGGRGRQLNAGCHAVETRWIWCLHADSRLDATAVATVLERADEKADAIYFLDLEFAPDGPLFTRLNGWGANARSRLFAMPFGDQAFLFPKTVWKKVGAFPEEEAYGEDHAFVWRARGKAIPLIRLPARVVTSARKYAERGWFRTTVVHFFLTWRQAGREWRQLKRGR